MHCYDNISEEEYNCLKILASSGPVTSACRPAVLERLQEMRLLEVQVQSLPMFPLGKSFKITTLGKKILAGSE
ncbi:hypothetical protein ABIE61_002613 [Marinobacterium sp. MBR-111]|jgi:hypothetical protein